MRTRAAASQQDASVRSRGRGRNFDKSASALGLGWPFLPRPERACRRGAIPETRESHSRRIESRAESQGPANGPSSENRGGNFGAIGDSRRLRARGISNLPNRPRLMKGIARFRPHLGTGLETSENKAARVLHRELPARWRRFSTRYRGRDTDLTDLGQKFRRWNLGMQFSDAFHWRISRPRIAASSVKNSYLVSRGRGRVREFLLSTPVYVAISSPD